MLGEIQQKNKKMYDKIWSLLISAVSEIFKQILCISIQIVRSHHNFCSYHVYKFISSSNALLEISQWSHKASKSKCNTKFNILTVFWMDGC